MKYSLVFLFLGLFSGNVFAQKSPDQKIMERMDTGVSSMQPYFYHVSPLLIIQDGKDAYRLDKSVMLDEIDPNWIDSMDVLKGEEAMEKFGLEGKDGVIVITFKEDVEDATLYLHNLKKKSRK
ncbi:hypothetical protein [Pontibacter arcticus]|uniref:TonB-dependent receptor plug domain-containing protein n=1 Tax=Pontibacter arcticus TaxID=2080288 RepID=A0A364RD35_9BACT|nr:hypothetical protein [Pontibacter arcticus]RAU82241.1 hypothetical protein DP923_10635 [Pontibacter arcticus]